MNHAIHPLRIHPQEAGTFPEYPGNGVVRVVPLGFAALEAERLKKMFQTAPQGSRQYVLSLGAAPQNGDVLLVNHDDPAAVAEQHARLAAAPDSVAVAISRGRLEPTPAYHLRGMLVAAKLFALLDRIPPPAAPPSGQEAPRLAAPAKMADAVEGYRALVVDDSEAIQKSLELHLLKLSRIAAVEFSGSGEEALRKINDTHYDLIFLDVLMPGIDGYETCARIRKLPGYKKTPIVMVSSKSSPMDEVKGVIAGCTTYLSKPVKDEAFQDLGRRVLSWLDHYAAGA